MDAGANGHGSDFSEFVSRTAPYAYARVFARTGDFARAQHLLAAGYQLGFREWTDRLPGDRASAVDRIVELASAQKQDEFGGGAPPASSYSGSAKVRATEGAAEILKSFPDVPRIALFLNLVEELPDDEILQLTGLTPAHLRNVRIELQAKVAAWRPGDPQAPEAFERILRQYRLSPTFTSEVLGRLSARGLRPRISRPLQVWGWRILRGLMCLAAGVAFLEMRVPLPWELRYFVLDDPETRARWVAAFPLWLDPILWVVSLNLRWAVSEADHGSLTGRLGLRGRLVGLQVLDHVGLCVLSWTFLMLMRVDRIDGYIFLHAPIVVRVVWFLMTLFLVVQVLAKLRVEARTT